MLFNLTSIHRSVSWLVVGLVCSSSLAYGQFPPRQNPGQSTIPSTSPTGGVPAQGITGDVQYELQPERPSPQMLMLLQAWEKQTTGIDTLQGVFRRYEYDSVFMTEKRAVGRYWFGSPDKARMDFQPDPEIVEAAKKTPGEKLTHQFNGKTYSVESEKTTSWICTGKEILEINHDLKQYSKMEIPAKFQGQRITDGPMPFLFGMKADSVSERYKMAFGPKHDPNSQIHIIAYPIVPGLRKEFQKAELLLDPKTYLPQAVKLWDPSGNKETTYMFFAPEPFTLGDKLRGPWSVYLGPPWACIADIKADPQQLPMQETRESSKFPLRRTTGTDNGLRTQ